MSDNKTKIDCRLVAREMVKASDRVSDDMKIPDPEPADGLQAMLDAMEEGQEDGNKSDYS